MALSETQAARVREIAERKGKDPDAAVKRAEALAEKRAPKPTPPEAAPVEKPGEGVKLAAPDTGSLPVTVRNGFFAYQFPVLKVNEIRASLGQPAVDDGDMFYDEWLKAHGGGADPMGGVP